MTEFFASGRVVDLILCLVAAEAALLVVIRRRTRRGPAPGEVLTYLLSGAFLLLALRAALVAAEWYWIALSLSAALAAHLADLRLRSRE